VIAGINYKKPTSRWAFTFYPHSIITTLEIFERTRPQAVR